MEKKECCFFRNVLVLINDGNLSGPLSEFSALLWLTTCIACQSSIVMIRASKPSISQWDEEGVYISSIKKVLSHTKSLPCSNSGLAIFCEQLDFCLGTKHQENSNLFELSFHCSSFSPFLSSLSKWYYCWFCWWLVGSTSWIELTYCYHMTAQPVGLVAYKQNRRKRQAYVFLNTTVKGQRKLVYTTTNKALIA